MPEVIWLCQDTMVERQADTGRTTMVDAARAAGCPSVYLSIDAARAAGRAPAWSYAEHIVVTWGTRAFTDALAPVLRPEGVFCSREAQEYALYAPHLRDVMLNPNFAILTWAEVVAQCAYDIEFFVKPAVHSKRFTGMVLNPGNREAKLADCTHVDPTTPCIVAPVRHQIGGEFRYVIVDGRVIDGSCYRWAGKLDVRSDTLPVADELARHVAALPWRPEDVFVCDVAVTEDCQQAFVIELNPFASSGLYACDLGAIAHAVTEHLRSRV